MPFMFVWSTILVTPLIMATGMIGMTDYLGYFFGMSSMESHLIAVGFTVFTVALLYRRIDSVARLTNLLWAGMIVDCARHHHRGLLALQRALAFTYPAGACILNGQVLPRSRRGPGAGRSSIFRLLHVTYVGDEVRNPGKVVPWSIIISISACWSST